MGFQDRDGEMAWVLQPFLGPSMRGSAIRIQEGVWIWDGDTTVPHAVGR